MTQNPLTIRLPDELAEALRTYAFVTHTSANGIVEAALTEYLKAHARTGRPDRGDQQGSACCACRLLATGWLRSPPPPSVSSCPIWGFCRSW